MVLGTDWTFRELCANSTITHVWIWITPKFEGPPRFFRNCPMRSICDPLHHNATLALFLGAVLLKIRHSTKVIIFDAPCTKYIRGWCTRYGEFYSRNWIHVMSDVTLHVNMTPLTVEDRLLIKISQTEKAGLLKDDCRVSIARQWKWRMLFDLLRIIESTGFAKRLSQSLSCSDRRRLEWTDSNIRSINNLNCSQDAQASHYKIFLMVEMFPWILQPFLQTCILSWQP